MPRKRDIQEDLNNAFIDANTKTYLKDYKKHINEKAIISENSDLWSSKKKHKIILEQVLVDMVKAILFLLNELAETQIENIDEEINDLNIKIKLNDSIIIDDEAQYAKDLDLVDRNMMAKWQVLVKWFGLTEEEAKQQILEAETEGVVEEEFNNPMPKPNPDETEAEFIERFMNNEEMQQEYPDEEQRLAVASDTWNESGS